MISFGIIIFPLSFIFLWFKVYLILMLCTKLLLEKISVTTASGWSFIVIIIIIIIISTYSTPSDITYNTVICFIQ